MSKTKASNLAGTDCGRCGRHFDYAYPGGQLAPSGRLVPAAPVRLEPGDAPPAHFVSPPPQTGTLYRDGKGRVRQHPLPAMCGGGS